MHAGRGGAVDEGLVRESVRAPRDEAAPFPHRHVHTAVTSPVEEGVCHRDVMAVTSHADVIPAVASSSFLHVSYIIPFEKEYFYFYTCLFSLTRQS
jgi:hypothetical protein